MDNGERNQRVAIACQGGGSHTAFTAGALKKIFEDLPEEYEIVALSGTSGGAICALLAWYGLLQGSKKKSAKLLDSFWKANSADTSGELLLNEWVLTTSRLQGIGLAPRISPYLYPSWAREELRALIEALINFDALHNLVKPSSPDLLVGAVEVLSGDFKVFDSRDSEISAEAILASAAIPTLFKAMNIGEKVYWDGLFSQNPPIRNFLAGRQISDKPDEIWIVQINPERRNHEPKTVLEIADRRNELSGNLSLNQELDFVESINKLIDYLPEDKYKPVEIRRIEMLQDLGHASKLDRGAGFIQETMGYGEEQAGDFLSRLA